MESASSIPTGCQCPSVLISHSSIMPGVWSRPNARQDREFSIGPATRFSGFSGAVPPGTTPFMLNPIAFLIYQLLGIYQWVVIVAVIVSWLIAFNVINQYNNIVRT